MANIKRGSESPSIKLRDLPREDLGFKIETANDIYAELKSLLIKNVKITGLDYQQENFMLNQLIDTNIIGYDKLLKAFRKVICSGTLNEFYNPTIATFITPYRSYQRKLSYDKNPAGAYFIQGLPNTSWHNILMRLATRISDVDRSIYQNLQACKTPFIAVCRDTNLRLSIEHAIQDRQEGLPVIVTSPEVGDALKGVETYTEYLVDRLNIYKQEVRAQALNAISIVTANTDKRERVQVGEVNAKIGECEDYIYTFIDNVNKQFETYGIPHKMELSASLQNYLDKIELDDAEEQNNADNEIEV